MLKLIICLIWSLFIGNNFAFFVICSQISEFIICLIGRRAALERADTVIQEKTRAKNKAKEPFVFVFVSMKRPDQKEIEKAICITLNWLKVILCNYLSIIDQKLQF